MAKLIYTSIASLDGYVADADGNFDWAEPDEEVHSFVNDLDRPVGTFLLGRRMYEVLVTWETLQTADQPPFIQDFRDIWLAADKIVYSKTLAAPSSARTRIDRTFDADEVRQMKASAGRDLHRGGSRSRRPGDQGRVGRRMPRVPRADRGGRWHPVHLRRRPP
jgi:dihydrofolate reductase